MQDPSTTTNTNGWNEYEKLVLYRLDTVDKKLQDQQDQLDDLEKNIHEISIEIRAFKKSAGAIGAIAGFLVSVVLFIADKLWKN